MYPPVSIQYYKGTLEVSEDVIVNELYGKIASFIAWMKGVGI